MTWEKAAPVDKLEAGPVLFKKGPKQIALFSRNGGVFAVDNRCPHEGYPLTEGALEEKDGGCLLTCNWHNWKFNLADGACVLGGDDVTAYPAKVLDGFVWVDLTGPSPEAVEKKILKGLKVAFNERDHPRICREIARLHYNRMDPAKAVFKAVQWSHDRLEYGSTHCYAAASDWLELADLWPGDFEKRLVCLAEAVDHMAFDALRHPPFPFPAAAADTFSKEAWLQAVEAQDSAAAEAMVLRALQDGMHWKELEGSFARAALSHYADFGHALIYVQKAGPLIARLGEEIEPYVLLPLTRLFCFATREDLLPEFKGAAARLASLPPFAAQDGPGLPPNPYPSTTLKALDWLKKHSTSHSPQQLHAVLTEALAQNLAHVDTTFQFAHDRPVSQNIGWLDFTHGVTFAVAVRVLCTRHPELWPAALVQMCCFLGRNRKFLDEKLSVDPWSVEDPAAFFHDTHERLLDHGQRDPIFACHLLKTARAVEEELPFHADAGRGVLLTALNRFLNSPLKQKHARRMAKQAIALVKLDFE